MNKKWECLEADEEKVKEISEEYNISSLLAKILVNKNIVEKEEIDLFLKLWKVSLKKEIYLIS